MWLISNHAPFKLFLDAHMGGTGCKQRVVVVGRLLFGATGISNLVTPGMVPWQNCFDREVVEI